MDSRTILIVLSIIASTLIIMGLLFFIDEHTKVATETPEKHWIKQDEERALELPSIDLSTNENRYQELLSHYQYLEIQKTQIMTLSTQRTILTIQLEIIRQIREETKQ